MKKQINKALILIAATALLILIQGYTKINKESINSISACQLTAEDNIFIIDTPNVIWINPAKQNSVLKSSKINIKAKIVSASGINKIVIYLNDVLYGEPEMTPSTTVKGEYLINKTMNLEPGNSTVYLKATNNIGTTKSESRTFTYQPEIEAKDMVTPGVQDAPAIAWTNPGTVNTTLRSSKSGIKATVRSAVGINKISIYLNDVLYGEPEMTPSATVKGEYLISKAMTFEPGNSAVYLTATNNVGTTSSEKRFFIYQPITEAKDVVLPVVQSVPVIIWTSPEIPNTTLKSLKSTIRATVKSTAGINKISVFLNDVLYGEPEMVPSTTEKGDYLISKTMTFEPGENTVYLVATNNIGTTTSERRSFMFPVTTIAPSVPSITWTNPTSANTALRSSKASIKATVKSGIGINKIAIYLNDVLYGEPEMTPSTTEKGNYLISKTMNFEPGNNTVYLMATNDLGTTTSEKLLFTYTAPAIIKDTTAVVIPAPTISWVAPSEKSTNLKSSETKINASVKSTSALVSVIIYVNGIFQGNCTISPVPDKPGNYIVERSLTFGQVENNIYLEATNEAGGNARSQPRSFICPLSSLMANRTQNAAPSGPEPVNQPKQDNSVKPVQPGKTEAAAVPSAKPIIPVSSPPEIIWTSPVGTKTAMDSFSGTVRAKIKSGEGLKSVLLYLNGLSNGETEIKPGDEAGSFVMEKFLNFGPGENSVYIVATNSAGATKSELRYFSNPKAVVPAITWLSPDVSNSVVNSETVKIGACIKSSTELRSVKLLVNGSILLEDNVFQSTGQKDCEYSWQSSVILRQGDNSIFIVASNAAGSTTSEKRTIKFTAEITEKRLALVVGNSDYKNGTTLKNPVNDANLMEATLKELGFMVIKRLDASRDDMLSAIKEFEDKLSSYNVALFYYAGHGNQVDGKNYLIPVDAKLEKPSDCKFEAIEVNLVVDEFERYQNNTNIVILDACRNNPFRSWARGGEAGFRTMNFTSGTIVAFATSEGATAADGKGNNGLYTEELVNQMIVPQSINDVFMNTRVQVRKKSNNLQVPSETNKLNGPFFFRK